MAGYDLDRFKKAQAGDYALALEEVNAGRKRSHWIWYIFPQLKGLGLSGMSDYYGIKDLGEAKAYMEDPVLRNRLLEISTAFESISTLNMPGLYRRPSPTPERYRILFSEAKYNLQQFSTYCVEQIRIN